MGQSRNPLALPSRQQAAQFGREGYAPFVVALGLALTAHGGLGNGLQGGVLRPAIEPPGSAQGVTIARDQFAHQFVIETVAGNGQCLALGSFDRRPGITRDAIAVLGGNARHLAASGVGLDASLGGGKPDTATDFDVERIEAFQGQGLRARPWQQP